MQSQNLKSKKTFERKLGTTYQQNLIELFGYIYMEPNALTKEDLAKEFTKNGIANERKIIRMIEDINTFCPYIKRTLNNTDGRTRYKIFEKFSETDLDIFYKKTNNAALLYIFLKSLLIKPISTEEVMEKINVSRKKANEMLNQILDASYLLDEIKTDNGYIIGHTRFFN